MKNLNINSYVWVKLTDVGKKKVELDQMNSFGKSFKPIKRKTKNGYTRFQLWEVMKLFGSEMYLANNNLPFDTNIKIAEEDLQNRAPYTRRKGTK